MSWEMIAETEHHGAYVVDEYGDTICDLYTMVVSQDFGRIPASFPNAEKNARLISAAPNLLSALVKAHRALLRTIGPKDPIVKESRAAISAARARRKP